MAWNFLLFFSVYQIIIILNIFNRVNYVMLIFGFHKITTSETYLIPELNIHINVEQK